MTIVNDIDHNGNQLKVGDRVHNAFRNIYDKYGASCQPDPAYFGTVLSFDEGCNGGAVVQIDGRPFTSNFVTTDLVKSTF